MFLSCGTLLFVLYKDTMEGYFHDAAGPMCCLMSGVMYCCFRCSLWVDVLLSDMWSGVLLSYMRGDVLLSDIWGDVLFNVLSDVVLPDV